VTGQPIPQYGPAKKQTAGQKEAGSSQTWRNLMALAIGSRLGPYEIIEPLRRGPQRAVCARWGARVGVGPHER